MMKRLSMILASLFLFVGLALAQTTVKGTVVTYEDNEPIIGASIQVVGAANIGTITDVNGAFFLIYVKRKWQNDTKKRLECDFYTKLFVFNNIML